MVKQFDESPEFKQQYEKALRKYDINSLFFILTAVTLLLFSLYIFEHIACQHKNEPIFVGETTSSLVGPENIKTLEFSLVFCFIGAVFAICIYFGIKRAKRNPALNCPLCRESLASESSRSHALMTGMCSHCKRPFFEGKLSNEQEAIEYYEKHQAETKSLLRSTFWSSILGSFASIPIWFWLKSSGELIGKEISSVGLLLFPAFFLLLPGTLWILSKSIDQKHQKYITAFRETSQ